MIFELARRSPCKNLTLINHEPLMDLCARDYVKKVILDDLFSGSIEVITLNQGGLIRWLAISSSGMWLGTEKSSGHITGLTISTWRAHEIEVLELVVNGENTLISSSLVQVISAWNVQDGRLKCYMREKKDYYNHQPSTQPPRKSLNDLTLKEIELYLQMPKDMRRIAPFLIISILPFANYVLFPLAYYFPRHLLCRHFWNLQQKSEFGIVFLQNRLVHNKPVFRYLQLQLPKLEEDALLDKWSHVLGTLGSGSQPRPMQILECKQLFETGPYHLAYLSRNHVKHLLKMHEVPLGWFRRTRLGDRALLLQAMDRSIMKDGLEKLPHDTLKTACLIRGLNPTNMKHEDMIEWMTKWLIISSEVNKNSLSLLLHCPVLLAYNEPTNWQLIYRSKPFF
ncbi:hypothetical protein FQR65_LT04684 [Abscondita terminalis]|nr:hypothetical protein FQR65_LT04684 [Abscondita terminalis]